MNDNIRISLTKEGRFQVAYKDPHTKKRVRKLYSTEVGADEAKAKVQLKIDEYHTKHGIFYVGNALKMYLKQYPESILIKRKNSFLSFCEYFNHFEVKDLTTEALKRWFDIIREEKGFTNKTLSCIKINLNAFFKWLVRNLYLPTNTLSPLRFKVKRSLQKPRVILSMGETKDMLVKLKELSPNEVYPFIYALVHTGARKDEIRQLTWDDVDFATGFINLRKTKNGRDRAIRMSDPLRDHLQMLQAANGGDGHLFLDRKGRHLSAWRIEDTLRRLQRKHLEMKKFTCHDVRHSFAFNFLDSGGQMYQLQAILGHCSIQLTVDLYGNLKASDVRDVSPFKF